MGECIIDGGYYGDFETEQFANTRAIHLAHQVPHRYGHTNNLSLLISGREEEQNDYLIGLVATAVSMFIFFLVWTFVLVIFKCLGPTKVGGMSGQMTPLPTPPIPPPIPPPETTSYEGNEPSQYKEDLAEWHTLYKKRGRRLNIARYAVVVAGISIIVSSICMSILGVGSLVRSVDSGIETLHIVQNLTRGATLLADAVLDAQWTAVGDIYTLLNEVNEFCPAIRQKICLNLDADSPICNWNGLEAVNVEQEWFETFVETWNTRTNLIYEQVETSKDDLEEMLEFVNNIERTAKSYNWAFQIARLFGLLLAALSFLIVLGIAVRLPKAVVCLRHWVLMPMFIFLVVLCSAFSLVFIIGSTSLADLCVDSPDDRMLLLVQRLQSHFSPLTYELVIFYISKCPLYQFPKGVVEQIEFLVTVIGSIRQLLTSWLAGSDQIQELCGLTQPPKYFEIAQITSDQLCALATILEDLRLYMQCGNWYPLYTKTVYDAMCYSGTEGFAWVAATQCIVVFMAMILLTARCAFYDLEILILEPDESSHRETSMKLERRPETNQEEEGGGDVTSVVNGIAEIPERWEEWEC